LTEAGPVGVAVIGAGRIGAVHVGNVAHHVSSAALIGVADVNVQAARALVKAANAGRVDDVAGFLGDPQVRCVIIATPTDTHSELIARAARAGKDIFCEKPISLRLDATRAAIDVAKSAGVLLQVGFQRRYDAEFARARELVATGAIGTPRFLRLVGRDHRIPSLSYLRTSGGQYRDQMIHEFDAARWLMAPRGVVDVYAEGSALADPSISEFGDVDTALAILKFEDGALCVIDAAREAVYGYDARAELYGSSGMTLVGHQRLALKERFGSEDASKEVESFIDRFEGAYRAEIADFISAVRTRRAPAVGGNDAYEALRIACAADRSRRERRPIGLADVNDD
jgi:myo-inositol 2-dehydrogenase/D-chiro-inositol 1-dehydrogenase